MRRLSLALLALPTLLSAMPMRPTSIPGDRLIKNLVAMLAKKPKDGRLLYLIGRAHYAMFARSYEADWPKSGEVEIYPGQDGVPSFPYIFGYTSPWDGSSAPKPTSVNLAHIRAAVSNLNASIANTKAPSGLEHLTLACVYESAAPIADKVVLASAKTKAAFLQLASSNYLKSFDLAYKSDQGEREVPIFGLRTLISYEAARSYLRTAPSGGRRGEVAIALRKFDALPKSGIVTPLIFSLSGSKSLSELLDPKSEVKFDLEGTGLPGRYGWVRPDTAILVWDPEGEGKIDSGRRLFGNATWWMLWSNAYEAMAALDDDGDGWLRGSELKGLGVWTDRNQNGRSEPGEVVAIGRTEIVALRTKSTGSIGLSLWTDGGIELRDGTRLPTYDWVTKARPKA